MGRDCTSRPPGGPVITRAFAATEISPGETWKIYLRATDPQGRMKAIYATVVQPGRGPLATAPIPLAEDQRRELSGFLYLHTSGHQGLAFETLTLTVQVRDRAGNFSPPVSFSLALNPRAGREEPPPGIFQERALGPLLVGPEPGTGGS
mgnify:CR=1 FL=1